jgi:2-haloacid dehalogenase
MQSSVTLRPRAVLFDAYGTLFDVHSVGVLAETLFPGHGAGLSQLWRDKQIEYTRLVSMSGRWRSFGELTRAGLRHAVLRLGLRHDAAALDALMQQYLKLMPRTARCWRRCIGAAYRAACCPTATPRCCAR